MTYDIEMLVKLDQKEEIEFSKFIKENRKQLISLPKKTIYKAIDRNQEKIDSFLQSGKISETILLLRQLAYDEFLNEECMLNAFVLSHISDKFSYPKDKLKVLGRKLYDLNLNSFENFCIHLKEFFGRYAGAISPYIYLLCLSNTQSRRSRAGSTFESIIYFLYERFNYSYISHANIGRKVFTNLGLGKVVDSILPSIDAFNERRDKTIVGSMKTTPRERWQEVVEEVTRSNLPNIYLLTVDDEISAKKAEQVAKHNIVLVVPKNVKKQEHLSEKKSIIDFETYFDDEIPSYMQYWSKH